MRLSCLAVLLIGVAVPALPQDRPEDRPQDRRALYPAEQEWLAAHNGERAGLGLVPLRWSHALTRDAAAWADHLARGQSLRHSPISTRSGQGENLWMGTRARFTPQQMIGGFLAEKSAFRPGRFPDVSSTGRWSDVGHYTQIIWPGTQEVGCAAVQNRSHEVLVCRYWPAGNVIGQTLDPAARLSRR